MIYGLYKNWNILTFASIIARIQSVQSFVSFIINKFDIPTVKANELRIDNLFELTDGTAAIVDYESDVLTNV